MKKLIRFGIPFQVNSLLGLLKDDLMTVFLGKILPFSQVGYLGWAKKWAEVPLRLFLDSIVRVTFPTFSRLQQSAELLIKGIEKTLFGLALLIFPVTVGLLFFVQPMVTLIPRYSKWEPAILSFYLFAITSAIAGLSSPLTNALNAIGKIKITLILMIMWTVLTWLSTIILIHFLGFEGFAWAVLLVSFTIVLVVNLVKKYVNFSFWKSIRYPLIGALLQAACYFILRGSTPFSYLHLILTGSMGVILYGGFVWLTEKSRITQILSVFSKKNE